MEKSKGIVIALLSIIFIALGLLWVADEYKPVEESVIEQELGAKPLEVKKPIKPKKKNQLTEKQYKELEKNLEKIKKGTLQLEGFTGDFEDEILKQLIK